jgi:hypothetical protein
MIESPETPLSDPVPSEEPGEGAPEEPMVPEEGGDEPGEESGDE